jgi:hypothetical protein
MFLFIYGFVVSLKKVCISGLLCGSLVLGSDDGPLGGRGDSIYGEMIDSGSSSVLLDCEEKSFLVEVDDLAGSDERLIDKSLFVHTNAHNEKFTVLVERFENSVKLTSTNSLFEKMGKSVTVVFGGHTVELKPAKDQDFSCLIAEMAKANFKLERREGQSLPLVNQ